MNELLTFSILDETRLSEALELVRDVFMEYEAPDYSDDGIQEFLRFIEPDAIRKMLTDGQMKIWACDCDGRIVGVLAAKSDHINLLFVCGKHHRKGIARRLLDAMTQHYQPSEISVNSSPYAVEAYRKLGFAETDAEQSVNGLRFTPMKRTGTAMSYLNDSTWPKIQEFLPPPNRLSKETMPDEYSLPLSGMKIHVDHYRVDSPKGTLVLFHGVGGNGRLLSFIAVRLAANGFEVICPDLPLYGYTKYSGRITYGTWVKCGCAVVSHYQEQGADNIVLFGLSAGGMLAYQVASECAGIKGVIATCVLDQRNPTVTRKTATNQFMGFIGKPFMGLIHKPFGGVKLPLKMVTKMSALANNADLVSLLVKDKRASGIAVPISFLYTMLTPEIKIEPEAFDKCPFLLVHPEKDNWTDVSLSRLFFDKLSCDKELRMLEGAGHFPFEENALAKLEESCVSFMEKVL
jgi:alpha-beta hydrolase superfamily lysophospholipase/GNAT superfamily N-acetyltransferase